MIQIPATKLRHAHPVLRSLRYEKNDNPVLRHVLGWVENGDLTLVAVTRDLLIECRVGKVEPAGANTSFLIPAEALREGAEAGKRSLVRMEASAESGQPFLRMTIVDEGRESTRTYATEVTGLFPERPSPDGGPVVLPMETMDAVRRVAPFASKDIVRRGCFCGVRFFPADGGMVMATDGRQMAILPATVPNHSFLLPVSAVRVLANKVFGAGNMEFILCDDAWVGFRSGDLTLFAKATSDGFPDYRRVIPDHFEASAEVPESHLQPLVAWLGSLKGSTACVRLASDRPDHLILTARNTKGTAAATFELPVELVGHPSSVWLKPSHLASAMTIGRNIRLAGPDMPCLVTGPTGEICVIAQPRVLLDN